MIRCTLCEENEAHLVSPEGQLLCDDCTDAFLMGQANSDAASEAIRNSGECECLQCLARPARQLVYIDGEPQLLCPHCWKAFKQGKLNPTAELKEIASFIAGWREAVEGYWAWFIRMVIDDTGQTYMLQHPQPISEGMQ